MCSSDLGECWQQCLEQWPNDYDEIYIDSSLFTSLMTGILEEESSYEIESINANAMGAEFNVVNYYDSDPKKVIEKAMENLAAILKKISYMPE